MGLLTGLGCAQWAWITEKLYIHGFSCYSCLLGLDMFDGLDYRHFPENLYVHSFIL